MTVKYYSGTAVYSTTFKTQNKRFWPDNCRVWLNLPGLHDIATVKVNGKECGIVWTAPYRVDITDAVRRGKNTLEIEVTNTWANALLGADQGNAPFDGIWTNGNFRREEQTLIPAGLVETPTLTIESK